MYMYHLHYIYNNALLIPLLGLSHSLSKKTMNSPSSFAATNIVSLSIPEQQKLLDKLQIFKIQGRDKQGNNLLHIIAKLFPSRVVSGVALSNYLEEKVFPKLQGDRPFSVVYVHTGVHRSDNFPGISTLRSINDAIPVNLKDNLAAVYFLHPNLQSRLFLATFGRLLFSGGQTGP